MNYEDHKVFPQNILYASYLCTYLYKLNSFMKANKKSIFATWTSILYSFLFEPTSSKHHHKVWKKDHLTLKLDSPCIKLCFMMPMWKVDDSKSKEKEKKASKAREEEQKIEYINIDTDGRDSFFSIVIFDSFFFCCCSSSFYVATYTQLLSH